MARVGFAVVVVAVLMQASAAQAQRILGEGVKDLANELAASATKVEKRRIAVVPFLELDGRRDLPGDFRTI